MMRKNSRAKGFTLIELLIALALIGFILAVLVVYLTRDTGDLALQSAIKQTANQMRQIAEAYKQYELDKGSSPRDLTDLVLYGYLTNNLISPPKQVIGEGPFRTYEIETLYPNVAYVKLSNVTSDAWMMASRVDVGGQLGLMVFNETGVISIKYRIK